METFTKAEAVALSAALADAIGRDKGRDSLTGVRVRQTDDVAVFDVTDGYRAHRVRVLMTTGEEQLDTWIPEGVPFCKALAVAARDAGKTGTVTVTFDTDTVTVAGPSVRHTFPIRFPGQYGGVPDTDPLFDRAISDAESGGATSARFTGSYLADAVSAGEAVANLADKYGGVTIAGLSEKTAALVTANGGRFGFSALVMPLRVR